MKWGNVLAFGLVCFAVAAAVEHQSVLAEYGARMASADAWARAAGAGLVWGLVGLGAAILFYRSKRRQ